MLGMLAGHAGDVENDAGDVDGLVENTTISRENAVKYDILLARTKNDKTKRRKHTKRENNSRNKSAPFPEPASFWETTFQRKSNNNRLFSTSFRSL